MNDNQHQLLGRQLQQRITLDDTVEIKCESCGKNVFLEGVFLRKISAILTGQPKDTIIPINVFYCASCNHINEEFIPNELKKKSKLV